MIFSYLLFYPFTNICQGIYLPINGCIELMLTLILKRMYNENIIHLENLMSKSFITKLLIFLVVCFVLAASLFISMLGSNTPTTPHQPTPSNVATVQPITNFEIPSPPKVAPRPQTPQLVDTKQQKPLVFTPSQVPSVAPNVQVASPNKQPSPADINIHTSTENVNKANVNPDTNRPSNPVASVPAITNENDKVCVIYGPLDIEEKSRMDLILGKYKQNNLAKVDKKTTYLIYWNLGSDKKEADKLFARLKENGGALADPKFVLTKNENGDYVVNIVRVNTGKVVAEKLTNDLISRAAKVNTGGQWLYKALPEGYFYTISDTNKLNPKVLQSINMLIEAPKDPC